MMNQIINGFEIIRRRSVDELGAECVEMKHIRTGAELVWMNTGAENKLFSIAFKTIPQDSTGVFHILEHSVLCGSEKYPVKEPFVELLKSSLNTFLNAMTFPDKTVYPVSSRNKTDFINLMRVYLDAVFKPAILSNPNIFYQEGWHYQLTDKDSQPAYNGVVFNEMKGAYSSVDRVVYEELYAQLFPDSCYGLSSGGDPVHIPDLTYEQFIDTYNRHYHPSNSRIYLDGDLPIDEVLEIIDREYLSGYEASSETIELAMQQPIASVEQVCEYEIGPDEDPTDRTHMIMGRVLCDWSDREMQLAAYVLGDYLTDSNDSPLKKAILEEGLGQEVSMSIDDGIAQPAVYLYIRNTSREKSQRINGVITNVARRLLEEGLDRCSLEAAMNRLEFSLREGKEPMGLERAINSLSSWLYGGDPLMYLTQDEVFRSLRGRLDTDYFERILADFLIDRRNTAVVWCEPSASLGEQRRQEEAQRAAQAAAAWSESEVESIIALNRELEKWQQTPDSPQALAMLPELNLSEVDPQPSERVTNVGSSGSVTVLSHPSEAKGIVYLTLYFDISDIERENVPAAALLAKLLGELPTSARSAAELNREIKTHIGSLSFSVREFAPQGDTESCRLFFAVRCSVLEEELDSAAALIAEVLTGTRYDIPEDISARSAQIYDLGRRMVVAQGHLFALKRTLSPYSVEADISERSGGYEYYAYLRRLNETEDKGAAAIRDFAEEFAAKVFCSSRLILSVTSGSEIYLDGIIDRLPVGEPCPVNAVRTPLPAPRKECIRIPAAISFASMGVNVYALEEEFSAELRLMSHIISLHYLWNSIRVQGGAYGAGLTAANNGNVGYYTYRDPNSSRSLGIFREASGFLREFCAEDGSLDKSIIGCISNLDPLVTVKERGEAADSDYFRGVTHEQRCRLWSDLLATDRSKLEKLCSLLDRLAQDGSVCVIGGADIVDACAPEQLSELPY